ncbi:hypothetical protein DRQ11_13025 [candidate division KSB1 bacterium]|nr:MAG: hypothetical protein DRQ11_13025 [candidate division KSB1 bacterium]
MICWQDQMVISIDLWFWLLIKAKEAYVNLFGVIQRSIYKPSPGNRGPFHRGLGDLRLLELFQLMGSHRHTVRGNLPL